MRKFFIDGNNLIHSIPELKKVFDNNKPGAVEKLIIYLNDFLLNSKNNATIFLDGFEPEHYYVIVNKNLSVKYSRNRTADFVMKSAIDNEPNKKVIVAVSNDLEVRNYAKVNLCQVKTASEFSVMLTKTSKKENQKFNPELSKNQIAEWEKIFNSGRREE